MTATRLFGVAVVAVLIGVAIGFLLPNATPAKPTINLSANSVHVGASYSAKISGFPANTEIYGWTVNENPPRTFKVGVTNAQGELDATANAPQTPGSWLLCASDEDNTNWATTVLTVTQS